MTLHLLALVALSWLQTGSPTTGVTAAPETRPRVIVFVNRSREIPAYVEYEDSSLLLIDPRNGLADCFHKDEIIGIARLIDLEEPADGMVILRDETRHRGLVVHDGFDEVRLLINGVPLVLPRHRVSHVVLEAPIDEQYLEYRLRIDPGDLHGHLNLCRWLIGKQAYDLARKELNQAWNVHQDPEAARLLRMVDAQIRLLEEHQSTPDTPADAPDVGRSNEPTLLTDREVNLVKVYEIDLNAPPKVLVPRNAIYELFGRYGSSGLIPDTELEQAKLAASPSIDIVRLMFRLRARDLYDRIEVLSEPRALQLFRERVHDTWLMNNCGTTRCHGGSESGRFPLVRSRSTHDRTRYTNLLTIDRFRFDDGTPLIDWDEPGQSRLIQYGLARDQTKTPHPDAPGWTPVFGGSRRALAKGTEAWIEAMMNTPRPVYPVGDQFAPAPDAKSPAGTAEPASVGPTPEPPPRP